MRLGYAVVLLVEALPYRPEGRGFDSRGGLWIFHGPNPSGRTVELGSTQPLTDVSTRNIYWWGMGEQHWRQVHRTDNLTTLRCRLSTNTVSLCFLESYGPLQAVNGIALLIPICVVLFFFFFLFSHTHSRACVHTLSLVVHIISPVVHIWIDTDYPFCGYRISINSYILFKLFFLGGGGWRLA